MFSSPGDLIKFFDSVLSTVSLRLANFGRCQWAAAVVPGQDVPGEAGHQGPPQVAHDDQIA